MDIVGPGRVDPSWIIAGLKIQMFYLIFIWTRGTLPRLRIDQLMTFAWKFMLPLALFNLLVLATEKMVWTESDLDDGFAWVWAAVNVVAAVVLLVAWAKVMGYRPGRVPTRPRLVKEATGYVPVAEARGGGR